MVRLRPATPLTVFFFTAFVLLLLSALSTPVIRSIPLGSYTNPSTHDYFEFGVWGWCGPQGCIDPTIGYTLNQVGEFTLPSNTRHTLSALLVVHPIAAALTLACTILAGALHFHGPSHSPRFLLWLLVLSFPTLLVSLLAFLVDILLFIPNMKWGGWIVLVATVIVVACSILTCAMRRTLVSRKARQKRIAENADMNGQNYYESQQQRQFNPIEPEFDRADSPPPAPGHGQVEENKQPIFATYDFGDRSRPSMDDRAPLNPSNPRAPSVRTTSTREIANNGSGRRSPVSPLDYDETTGLTNEPRGPPSGSHEGAPVRDGPPPFYSRGGRGGFPPNRGGYPPRGGYPSRGGYPPRGGPGRGGYPPRGGFYRGGPRGPPPPGWNGRGRGMGPMAGAAMLGGAHRGPPPGYQNGYTGPRGQPYVQDGPYSGPGGAMYDQNQHRPAPNRSLSDEQGYEPTSEYSLRDPANERTSDFAPPIGVDSERRPSDIQRDPATFGFNGPLRPRQHSDDQTPLQATTPEETSRGQAVELDATASNSTHANGGYNHPPYQTEPIELGDRSPPQQSLARSPVGDMPSAHIGANPTSSTTRPPVHGRTSSDAYVEDVDPRFAQDENLGHDQTAHASPLPSSLTAGFGQSSATQQYHRMQPQQLESNREPPYFADSHNRTISPAHSDNSNFTSISQREINPEWQGPPQETPYGGYGRRPPPQTRRPDHVFSSNPDFSLPGALPGRTRPGRSNMAITHTHERSGSGSQSGMTGAGRYPGAI